ncbi:hypothetical protein [Nocardia sp. NBC_01377]|uniref:hypothetical protein n=1 Tax=Nocardia sp. NBC_01377 TaxID=2903595 RepID=UPI002F9166FF
MSWLDSQTAAAAERLRQSLAHPNASRVRVYAGDDTDFACWLLASDEHCELNHHVSIFDLSDIDWRELYDDGASPVEAVRETEAGS